MNSDKPYRFGAGIMLLNRDRLAWVGQRIDNPGPAWQMPQGGIDPGEDSWQGALRELEEETGIAPSLVQRVEKAPMLDLVYDIPEGLRENLWGGRYAGQRQHWFLAGFEGRDSDVNIATDHPEFSAWQWVSPRQLPDLIVPFKRDMYRAIIEGFARWL
ncbi:RNA pyrophosphohydrolase [Sphingomicrobium lutaoense]|uniref:Putative (Di)nucleoside polyphosphate hydrolase n=1 Tax=Sphingomicrobium lutaoense TaxID=515949 RepID=A0A839Z0S5_9SPHN|nr:RNA pyrophosphohydrolase [Sphingomicrobium lutaoense]MBB3763282.1 putative (di)nucleoside polyphosphate hydrolase [Sphingomicrobium lutaoense]